MIMIDKIKISNTAQFWSNVSSLMLHFLVIEANGFGEKVHREQLRNLARAIALKCQHKAPKYKLHIKFNIHDMHAIWQYQQWIEVDQKIILRPPYNMYYGELMTRMQEEIRNEEEKKSLTQNIDSI